MEGYIVQHKFVRTDNPKPSDKKDDQKKESEKSDS
ncbi:hypothetical protein UGMREWDR_CDS0131 [Aeromonas phage GomatiRiver_11]|nr:hypothetical protein OBDJBBDK_00122 [Aeromonas phage AhFM11]WKW84298.1 hypothetical protein UGMREWDR_CDS0131 [Aeromonas phage GomatiRiver_11]